MYKACHTSPEEMKPPPAGKCLQNIPRIFAGSLLAVCVIVSTLFPAALPPALSLSQPSQAGQPLFTPPLCCLHPPAVTGWSASELPASASIGPVLPPPPLFAFCEKDT